VTLLCEQVGSAKDVTDRMSKVRDTLSDVTADWEKRTDEVCLTSSRIIQINPMCVYPFRQT